MPSLKAFRVAFSAGCGALAILAASPARAGDRIEVCASAAEEAQSLRSQGHLGAARKKLVVCADDGCPAVVKDHCATWLTEVDKATPTLVVRARDGRGLDVSGAKVLLDGAELLPSITGRAVPVDPGPHTLRVVATSGAASEQAVVIAEGEKDRAIVISFAESLKPDGTVEGAAPARPSDRERALEPAPGPPSPSRITAPFVVSVSIAVVGLGVFTGLEIAGQHEYQTMKDGCATVHHCDPGAISADKAKLYGAGVALGVGVVALGVATIVFATHTSSPGVAKQARSLFAPRRAPSAFDLAHF